MERWKVDLVTGRMDQSLKHLIFSLVFSTVVAALVLLAFLAPWWQLRAAALVAVAAFLWMIVRKPATFYRRMLHLLIGAVALISGPNVSVALRLQLEALVLQRSPEWLGALFTGEGGLHLWLGGVSPQLATILCVFAALLVFGDVAQQAIANRRSRQPVAWLAARTDRSYSADATAQGVDA